MRGAKPSSIQPASSPITDRLDPPDWLSGDALTEWNRVARILIEERQTLTEADVPSLILYCVAVGTVVEMSRIIAKEGHTYMSKTGPKKRPEVAIRNDASTQARLLAVELGLTPVSRGRRGGGGAAESGFGPLFDGGLF